LHGQNGFVDALVTQIGEHPFDEGHANQGQHRFGGIAGQRAQARPEPTNENYSFHAYDSLIA
jgi:hypothetical protein